MNDTSSIQIQILAGSAAGRTLRLSGPQISIGRDESCDVVIDLPFISRVQCELRLAVDRWVLVNRSDNGTQLSRKLVTSKPRPIQDGDVLRVGKQSVAQLIPLIIPAADAPSNAAAAAPSSEAQQTSSPSGGGGGKSKLWIGIGVYVLIMLGFIVFGATLTRKPAETDNIASIRTVSNDQIAEEIRKPQEKRAPQELKMTEQLQRARELFEMRDSQADALYRCHEAYQVALTYAVGDAFPDPLDQRRYQLAQQELIQRVTEGYRSASDLLAARRFDEAAAMFARLEAMYPAGRDSSVYRSIQQQHAAARRELDKR
ncbi:MAG: FHA domain-containing protein [Phycisphaeraceae bacterium]|nr:FHA domain-containing protein [Phycisphaeraceae bacterium]